MRMSFLSKCGFWSKNCLVVVGALSLSVSQVAAEWPVLASMGASQSWWEQAQKDIAPDSSNLSSKLLLSVNTDWQMETDQEGARAGYSISLAGDVNGDGYGDVIVGVPFYDQGQEDEGAAFVYYGSEVGLSTSPDWVGQCNQESAYYGISVSTAGDVNGDGFSDVIVGAASYDHGEEGEGKVFVYMGSSSGLSSTASFEMESNQANAEFGRYVSTAGDVNGDGYDEIIVGAPGYTNGQYTGGRVYVFHGSSSGLHSSVDWTASGKSSGDNFGRCVSVAGDVNGDGYDDVIIGAPYDGTGGKAYVYHGSSTGLSNSSDWVAEGSQENAWFGISASSSGDVNGDGYDDVIVGAPHYSNGETWEGAAFVYHGSTTGLSSTHQWLKEGDQENANYGKSVSSAGDVNADGLSDVIVGADFYDYISDDEGMAFLYLGTAAGVSTSALLTMRVGIETAAFGRSVSTAGDVNGDGFDDMLIGAPFYSDGEDKEGGAFVYYGSTFEIAPPADLVLAEGGDNGGFGSCVSTAGDVNGDGFGDVIVGSRNFSNGKYSEGAVFVYYGSASGLSDVAGWSLEGNQRHASLGLAVSTAGDVNGDGYDDVLISSNEYEDNQVRPGRVYLYYGSSTGLSDSPAWMQEGTEKFGLFGEKVSSLGDVNGDGYDDVCISDVLYSNEERDEGLVVVYHGSSTGLSDSPDWSAEGNRNSAYLGGVVTTAGDVNGDGYDDLFVEGNHTVDDPLEMPALVYYGSSSGLSTTADWMMGSNTLSHLVGDGSSAGDVNGDGFDDIILGGHDHDKKLAFVFYGSASGLETSPSWEVSMDIDQVGWCLTSSSAGDVNGDGYGDVIVGAPEYGSTDSQRWEGIIYLYHGSPSGLSLTPNWEAESNQGGVFLGMYLFPGGDVNGDGLDELVLGASGYTHNGVRSGAAFVYYGEQQFFLSYTVKGKGSISGEVTQPIEPGEDGTQVEAVPAAGYKFFGWSDGSTENPRTDTNVTENIFVSAIFVQDEATGWMFF
jgi:FG-GAP repeat/Divergent InlB B-repeat domain